MGEYLDEKLALLPAVQTRQQRSYVVYVKLFAIHNTYYAFIYSMYVRTEIGKQRRHRVMPTQWSHAFKGQDITLS